jgi:hypothetical protein
MNRDTILMLGDYLASHALNLTGCNNDLAYVTTFLAQHPLLRHDQARIVDWLQDNGGSCDCRALLTIVARTCQMV